MRLVVVCKWLPFDVHVWWALFDCLTAFAAPRFALDLMRGLRGKSRTLSKSVPVCWCMNVAVHQFEY